MASALVSSHQASRTFPLWLSRLHSWWFIGQVVANVVAAWFIIRLVSEMDWAELGLGLLVGQGFLLSAWLALGGLPNVARFISVLMVTLAGALAVGDQRWAIPNWAEWLEQTSQVFIVCFFMVLLFHGLLLPLRWLLGWRLDFDPAYHSRETTGRLQVGVVHFLGWTTFVAIPCAIIRLIPREDLAEVATICLSVSAMTLPVAATSTMAVVGKKSWRWSLLAAAVFGIMLAAEVCIPGLDFIPRLIFSENFLQFNLGIVAAVAGNLVILRLLGLRLFSIIQQTDSSVSPRENTVKRPHFQIQPAARQSAGASGS